MSYLVHQAYYGEREGAHDVRAASDRTIARRHAILRRTDRPSTAPGRADWEPSIVGFHDAETFVLARLFPDPAADREGMVWTHALLLDRTVASNLDDLGLLIDLLATSPRPDADLSPLVIEVSDRPTQVPPSPGLAATAAGLLDIAGGGPPRPVVWLSPETFPDLIRALWQRLWPALRRDLAFGLAFAPSDVAADQLLVASPGSHAGRWIDHPIVRPSDPDPELSMAARYLIGHSDGAALGVLRAELGAPLQQLRQLLVLGDYAAGLPQTGDGAPVDAVRLQVRRLAELAPQPEQGMGHKQRLLGRLATLTAVGDAATVSALRNLPREPFSTWEETLGEAIATWSARLFSTPPPDAAASYATMFRAAYRMSTSAWGSLVRQGVDQALLSWQPLAAPVLWRLWSSAPDDPVPPPAAVPQQPAIEADLAHACPLALPSALVTTLAPWARERNWLTVHAAIVAASFPPEVAFQQQLVADSDPSSVAGLATLAARVPGADLVAAALAHDDERLSRLAGAACARDPGLLSDLKPGEQRWRRIWLSSIEHGGDPVAGLTNPAQSMMRLLNAVVNGQPVEGPLLVAMSGTAYGDLASYPLREQILAAVPQAAAANFRSITATAWYRRFSLDPQGSPLADDLASSVLAPEQFVAWLKADPAPLDSLVIALAARFSRITEAEFSLWINARLDRGARLDNRDAAALGRLAADQGWRGIARGLADRVLRQQRDDLRVAVASCLGLLPWLQRWELHFHDIGDHTASVDDDWWAALGDVTASLYPAGLQDRVIWQRAGGEIEGVELTGSGRQQWIAALHLLRGGGGGKITRERLLRAMREDWPQNRDVANLESRQPWR